MQRGGEQALDAFETASPDCESERKAVAGYLHDEVIPPLAAALMQVGLIDSADHPELQEIEDSVQRAGQAVRRLMQALDTANNSGG